MRDWILSAFLATVVAPGAVSASQELRSSGDVPLAFWASPPGVDGDAYGVFHFRRGFELAERPASFRVRVSADNRYRLYVNGESVAAGPQRSDLMHWRYDSLDLAPWLRPGRNVLAVAVWNWGVHRPVAQFSHRTALLVQGDTASEAIVNSGRDWRVLGVGGYAPVPVDGAALGGYFAAPPGESLDAARYPWGWQSADFDDSGWGSAEIREGWFGEPGRPRGGTPTGEAGGWQLVPRTLPPMEEREVRFAKLRRAEGLDADPGFLSGRSDLVVPPRTRGVLLLDQGHMTNAYAVLETSGGAGSRIRLRYAEALRDAEGNKGNRDAIEGKTLVGLEDRFHLDGGEHRRFQTLWFRTYRYVELEVETAETPLRIHDLLGIFTGYPFELRARFEAGPRWIAEVWEIDWRTARLCAWETYFDTPYWEQLQYVGDTRLQALLSLYLSGDDRLVRQALFHFDRSRIPEGITASRHPSALPQFIPPYSLIHVAMVHDYAMLRDDPAFVRGLIPGVRSVLGWFADRVDDTGLPGPMPFWNYVDWTPEWELGVPPGAGDGHSSLIALTYAWALRLGAALEELYGSADLAGDYRSRADRVVAAVRERAWDPQRGLFRDSPDAAGFSQQTNVFAVLARAVPEADRGALVERILSEPGLVQASYQFRFYLFEALLEAGLGHRYLEQLAPWRGMLELGLTTTPERPEPTRSDSHAWSAHPSYGLLATVLGVRPGAPGFASVRIAPHLGELERAAGRVPHPLGDIELRLERVGERGLRAEVTLPSGLGGRFEWNGASRSLRPGSQTLELEP